MRNHHEQAARQRVNTQELMKLLRHEQAEETLAQYPFEKSGTPMFCTQLSAHLERAGMTLSALGEATLLSRSFVYQVGSGMRVPSRDIVLRIALVLELDVEQTQHLLATARRGALYPRIHRDAILVYCLERRLGLMKAEDMLKAEGEESLL